MNYNAMIKTSIVAEGLEGKIIMLYGNNNTGKSYNGAKAEKPVFIPIERNALNAIGDIPYVPIYDWVTFKDFVDSLKKDKKTYEGLLYKLERLQSKPEPKKENKESEKKFQKRLEQHRKNIEVAKRKIEESEYKKFKEANQTLVLDTLSALGKSCEFFVVGKDNVENLSDVGHGKLYKKFENEFFRVITDYFNLGDFTYIILNHETFDNIGTEDNPVYKALPMGDFKRIVKPVINRCDIVAYLRDNGSDENDVPIKSSAIINNCSLCFGRTKWTNMDVYIEEFSLGALEEVLKKAIQEQKDGGMTVGTNRQQQQDYIDKLRLNIKDVKARIKKIGNIIYKFEGSDHEGKLMTRFYKLIADNLGEFSLETAGEAQMSALMYIRSRGEEILEEIKEIIYKRKNGEYVEYDDDDHEEDDQDQGYDDDGDEYDDEEYENESEDEDDDSEEYEDDESDDEEYEDDEDDED